MGLRQGGEVESGGVEGWGDGDGVGVDLGVCPGGGWGILSPTASAKHIQVFGLVDGAEVGEGGSDLIGRSHNQVQ